MPAVAPSSGTLVELLAFWCVGDLQGLSEIPAAMQSFQHACCSAATLMIAVEYCAGSFGQSCKGTVLLCFVLVASRLPEHFKMAWMSMCAYHARQRQLHWMWHYELPNLSCHPTRQSHWARDRPGHEPTPVELASTVASHVAHHAEWLIEVCLLVTVSNPVLHHTIATHMAVTGLQTPFLLLAIEPVE